MGIDLPSFKGEEKDTLYIIGNGFDLFHGLKTRYADFRNWLLKYKYTNYIEIWEKAFPAVSNGECLLWKDFEVALGETSPQIIHRELFQGEDDGWYDENVQKRVHNRIKPCLDNIPDRLREWIETVKVDGVKRKIPLSRDSKYLSFNYTRLLEDVYRISSTEKLLHIHGSLDDKTPLIIGHHRLYREEESSNNVNEEKSCNLIAMDLNHLRKRVDDIIQQHKRFFSNLDHIKNVVIFGWSLSAIDREYFSEVYHHVHDDTHWHFVYYDDKVKEDYQQLVFAYNDTTRHVFNSHVYRKKLLPENCNYINIIK